MKQSQYGYGIGGLFAAIMVLCGTAQAATYYWDNNGSTAGFGSASGTWAVPTTGDSSQGWSTSNTGVLVPGSVTTTNGDALNFGTASAGLAGGTINVSGSVTGLSLTIGSASGAITLSGGTVVLPVSTAQIINNSASRLTIGSNIDFGSAGSYRYLTGGSGGITVNGSITGSGSGPRVNTTGTLTISGNITGEALQINSGTVTVGNSGLTWAGVTSTDTGTPGGTLDLNGNNLSVYGINGGITITDNAAASGTSLLTLTGGTSIPANSCIITDGAIRKVAITYNGTTSLTLSQTNTYSGNTKSAANKINLNNNLAIQNSAIDTSGAGVFVLGTGINTPTIGGLVGNKNLASVFDATYTNMTSLTLNPVAGLTNSYGGNITNNVAGLAVVKTGAGTQTLTGTNTFLGGTIVSNGTLLVEGVITSSCPVTVTLNGVLGGGGSVGVVTNYGKIVATITNVNGGASGGCAYLHATGAVTLEPGCRFSLSDPNNYLQTSAGPYTVLAATGGITPNGFGSNLDNVPNGWQIQYQGTSIILKKGSFNGMVIRIH